MEPIKPRKLATLARLRLTEEEEQEWESDLESIIQLIDVIQEVPTDGLDPLLQPIQESQILSEDIPEPDIPCDLYQSQTKHIAKNLYLVPKFIKR